MILALPRLRNCLHLSAFEPREGLSNARDEMLGHAGIRILEGLRIAHQEYRHAANTRDGVLAMRHDSANEP